MQTAHPSQPDTHRPEVRRPWSPAVRFCGLALLLLLALALFAGGFALILWGTGNVLGLLFVASGPTYLLLLCLAGLVLMAAGSLLFLSMLLKWWLRSYE